MNILQKLIHGDVDMDRDYSKIVDRNGAEIKVGQTVLVHQDEKTGIAKVHELFPDNPTKNEVGFWVDINSGDGLQGMMSYILEVVSDDFGLNLGEEDLNLSVVADNESTNKINEDIDLYLGLVTDNDEADDKIKEE